MIWEVTPDKKGYMESFQRAIIKADSEEEAIEIAESYLPSEYVKQKWSAKQLGLYEMENGIISAEYING